MECVARATALCEDCCLNCYLSVPMVLHQPSLDGHVDVVPGAGVDQKENRWQDDGKSKYKREDGCPEDKPTPRVVTSTPSNPVF